MLVASTIIPVGYLSDVLGRRWIFITTLFVLLIACIGFIFATSIEQLYIFMFLFGITFPGRMIVGINYAYEFQTKVWAEYVQPVNQYVQGFTLILTAFYFQCISKSIIYLEITHVIFVIYLLVQTYVLFPESPRFDYSKERYAKSKESLTEVSKVNGNPNYNAHKFKFDVEK